MSICYASGYQIRSIARYQFFAVALRYPSVLMTRLRDFGDFMGIADITPNRVTRMGIGILPTNLRVLEFGTIFHWLISLARQNEIIIGTSSPIVVTEDGYEDLTPGVIWGRFSRRLISGTAGEIHGQVSGRMFFV